MKSMPINGPIIPDLRILQNLHYTTTRIKTFKDDVDSGGGTGFFVHAYEYDEPSDTHRPIPLLITNKHIIEDADGISITVHIGESLERGLNGSEEIYVEDVKSKVKNHPDENIDLCALDMSPYFSEEKKLTGRRVFYQAFTIYNIPTDQEMKKVFPVSDVYMVGYPDGLWDEKNNLPIVRRGVVATHPYYDYNGEQRGLLDIASFGGSSGSPIILFEQGPPRYDAPPELKFYLLGIFESFLCTDAEGKLVSSPTDGPDITTKIPLHLGAYIKSYALQELSHLFNNS